MVFPVPIAVGPRRVPLSRRPSSPQATRMVGVLMATLVGLVAWTARNYAPLVSVRTCVSPDRRFSWLGLHLALLHPHPDCAAGELALGPTGGRVSGLVVMVVTPTLVMNLIAMLALWGVWAALRAVPARVVSALRRLRPRRPEPPRIRAVRRMLPRPVGLPVRRSWLDRSPVQRRGPPVDLAW